MHRRLAAGDRASAPELGILQRILNTEHLDLHQAGNGGRSATWLAGPRRWPVPHRHVEESDEQYLLTPTGGNVNIRRPALVDTSKTLIEVDRRRLQQWHPTLKVPFPLSGDQVTTAFFERSASRPLNRIHARTGRAARRRRGDATVRLVSVHKRRVRSELDGCWVELTDIEVGDLATRTLAIEAACSTPTRCGPSSPRRPGTVNTSVPRRPARPGRGRTALLRGDRRRDELVKFHVAEQRDVDEAAARPRSSRDHAARRRDRRVGRDSTVAVVRTTTAQRTR